MSNKQLRQFLRLFHSVVAIVLGLFIYGPWGDGSLLEASIQYVIFPALALSGLLMWQQPRLNKLMRRRASS
jgi:hypothetical protein